MFPECLPKLFQVRDRSVGTECACVPHVGPFPMNAKCLTLGGAQLLTLGPCRATPQIDLPRKLTQLPPGESAMRNEVVRRI